MNNTVINRYGSDHSRAFVSQFLAEWLGITMAGKIHDCFCAEINGTHNFLHFDIVVFAFCASLLRTLLGLGSLMAFPGSMVGALCCCLVYKKCHILSLTCLAEAIGTGFLGALAAYPVALYLMGIAPAGLFVYVVPFLFPEL